MAQELTGSNGKIVGSEEYFYQLTHRTLLGEIMEDSSKNYYESILEVGQKALKAFEGIYEDLKSNANIIRYIPPENRKNLTKVILGLADIPKLFGGSSTGKADECVRILALTDSITRMKSNASDRDIAEAVKIIEKGGSTNIPGYDRITVIEKAIDWDVCDRRLWRKQGA